MGLGGLVAELSVVRNIVNLMGAAPAMVSIGTTVEPVAASSLGVAILNQILFGPRILGMGLVLTLVTVQSGTTKPYPHPLV